MLQFKNTLSPLSQRILDFAGKLFENSIQTYLFFFPQVMDSWCLYRHTVEILYLDNFFELITLHTVFYTYIKKKTKKA